MQSLNRYEVASHLDISSRETLPFHRSSRIRTPFGESHARSVEFNSRDHHAPEAHNRSDRNLFSFMVLHFSFL